MQMKKTYKFLAIIALIAFIAGTTGCKAGCGCPKFKVENVK